jgi:hypothetical protein
MTLELLYLPGCPNHSAAVSLVRNVLEAEGLSTHFGETPISDYDEAMMHSFPGSPTLRVNGQDIENVPSGSLKVGFACRTYVVDGKLQGVPPRSWLERAVRAARIQEEDQR